MEMETLYLETMIPNHTIDLWGRDTVRVNSTLPLHGFPFGISRGQGEAMNTLGIGRNSSLLNALFSSGAIASKTWSYWHGWAGAENQFQKDESLIIGGYDAAKIIGNNITLPFANDEPENCPGGHVVAVKDIKMDFTNGSSQSIFGSSRGSYTMRACADGTSPTMKLSMEIWNAFLAVSGSTEVGRSMNPVALDGILVAAGGA